MKLMWVCTSYSWKYYILVVIGGNQVTMSRSNCLRFKIFSPSAYTMRKRLSSLPVYTENRSTCSCHFSSQHGECWCLESERKRKFAELFFFCCHLNAPSFEHNINIIIIIWLCRWSKRWTQHWPCNLLVFFIHWSYEKKSTMHRIIIRWWSI